MEWAASVPVDAAVPVKNKTIVLQWVAVGTHTEDRRTVSFRTINTRTVYVSSSGRIFTRASRQSMGRGGGADTREIAPGNGGRSIDGGSASTRFVSNTLVNQAQLRTGGFQTVATFDPSFTSCSLQVIYGRGDGQPIEHRLASGATRVLDSISAASPTCEIREGNPF